MIDQLGCSINAVKGQLEIMYKGAIIMKGIKRNSLYVTIGSLPQLGINASASSNRTKLWHIKLVHMLGGDHISSLEFFEKCVIGKATRHKFSTGRYETKQTLDYVHSNLWRPSQVLSYGRARYFFSPL